jgi:NitT/TauT family transport system substrate-binding protein
MERFTLFLSYLLLALFTVSCGDKTADTSEAVHEEDSTAVRIAVLPTLDCLPLFLASDYGLFRQEGLDIELVEYSAQMDCDTAIVGGSVGLMATDLVRVDQLRRKENMTLSYLTATEASWQLFTSRAARIRQLKLLYDKMLAMTRHSATDMLADMTVDSAKIADDKVFRIQVNDLSVRMAMMQSDIMDAMLLPEPYATAAHNLGAYRLLDASRQFDLQLGVIVMRDSLLSKQQQEAFVRAYDRACDTINAMGIQAFREVIKDRMGATDQTVDSLPAKYEFRHAAQPRQSDEERARQWLTRKLENEDVEKQPIQ